MKRLILVLLAIGVLTTSAFCLTGADLREQVRFRIQDTTSSVTTQDYSWSSDILNKRINIVQDLIVFRTRCLYGRSIIYSTASVQEYPMPSDCIMLDRVSFSQNTSTTSYKKLAWYRLTGLDRDKGVWEGSAAGLPQNYYERNNFVGLYPKPSSTYAGTDTIKMDYYKKANSMDSDSAVPFDGVYSLYGYHNLIIEGVVILCLQDRYYWDTTIQGLYLKLWGPGGEVDKMAKEILDGKDRQETIGR
jgi:hypothetical protein